MDKAIFELKAEAEKDTQPRITFLKISKQKYAELDDLDDSYLKTVSMPELYDAVLGPRPIMSATNRNSD